MAIPKSQTDNPDSFALPQQWLVRFVAFTTATSGFLTIFQPLADRLSGHLQSLLIPFDYDQLNRVAAIFLGFALIYFSVMLLQRKIVAWWSALAISVGIALVHVVYGRDILAILAPTLTISILIATKDQFRVKSESESIFQGVKLLALSVAVALLYGVIGFWLLERRDFGQTFGLSSAVIHTLKEYALLGNADLIPHTRYARWFLHSLDFLGALSVGFGIYSLFRPLAYRYATLPSERQEVSEILRLHGDSPEDFFKLWPEDKSYFFSPRRNAFIAYRVAAGVAIALHDPVGPISEAEPLITNFVQFAYANGWAAAFVDVPAKAMNLFEDQAMRILKIGEDAVVYLNHFAAEVAPNKHFRYIRNKFDKEGYSFEFKQPPHDRQLLNQIQRVSEEWLDIPGREERGFALGYFNRHYLGGMPLYLVRNRAGRIMAFANAIPTYRSPVATVDLMRHRSEAPSNTMDYLFMQIMLYLHDQGLEQFSLGLAPLSGMGEGDQRNTEERLLGYLYRGGGRLFSFAGLRQFKNKFEPDWQEKSLVYTGGPQTLAQIALALSQVLKAR